MHRSAGAELEVIAQGGAEWKTAWREVSLQGRRTIRRANQRGEPMRGVWRAALAAGAASRSLRWLGNRRAVRPAVGVCVLVAAVFVALAAAGVTARLVVYIPALLIPAAQMLLLWPRLADRLTRSRESDLALLRRFTAAGPAPGGDVE